MARVHRRVAVMVVAVLAGLVACTQTLNQDEDPLDGTTWTLETYAKSRPIPGTTISASFIEGKVSGSAGCNSYKGSYHVNGARIQIAELAWTLMACQGPEGIMEQEQRVMEILGGVERFHIVDGKLQLERSDHETLILIPSGKP